MGSDSQPIKPIVGGFIATGDDQPTLLAAENAAKYTPYVAVIRKVNPKLVSELYFHFQPLFQQAYEELTKSDGRFDDRVLQAIDGLIDAPELRDPVLVVAGMCTTSSSIRISSSWSGRPEVHDPPGS